MCLLAVFAATAASTNSPVTVSGSLSVREAFDDNVYLQSLGPRADKSSLVTTITPQVGAAWKPSPAFDAAIGYSAGINWFHEQTRENFTVHKALLNATARLNDTVIETANSIVGIDGDDVGLVWLEPGGAPATGGPAVRDRRDAMIYRNSLRLTQPFAKEWFVRPVASYYLHDFGTEHRATKGYLNFVDRDEWTAGADLGRKIEDGLVGVVGYRYGAQSQAKLLEFPEQYDSQFHRVLFGVEGAITSWLKATVSVGPEFRQYEETVARDFERSRVNLFVDASVTITPTKLDAYTVGARQFQQPGFAGRSTYDDLTYDFEWRHRFSKEWTTTVATRAYNTHFLWPAHRDDWIVGPLAAVNYAFNSHFNIEASAAYEAGITTTEHAEGREYDRMLVALGLKYTWK